MDGGVILLCIEVSEQLLEPMCSSFELQEELVPYVLSQSLESAAFLKLSKSERQVKLKMLTQRILSGEDGEGEGGHLQSEEGEDSFSPSRFWAHLRAKYGTRFARVLDLLRLLEHQLRQWRVQVLFFEGDTAPTASLLVRSSEPVLSNAAFRHDFSRGSFNTAALGALLQASKRPPPLWARLADGNGEVQRRALLLFTEGRSTESAPETLQLAARCFHGDETVPALAATPYVSVVTFGTQFSSERLAGLEELAAWSGGLSFNVAESSLLEPAAEGLAAHVFHSGEVQGLERRRFYAQKQVLGTCFLQLPKLAQADVDVSPLAPSPSASSCGLSGLLRASAYDGTVPSEAMLAVLSETSLALPRRWGRSLRVCRMRRGLRDVVFGEPGGLGLDLEEPEVSSSSSSSTWRLRATHPPASALNMEERSELVAINLVNVTGDTPRSEVARRISARPVLLTFRLPNSPRRQVMDTAIALAEVVVAELREGWPPLKTGAPPLSTAAEKMAALKTKIARRSLALVQADAVLVSSAQLTSGALEDRATSSSHRFTSSPSLLFRVLLFAGEAVCLVRVSLSSRRWRSWLDLSERQNELELEGISSPKQSLWSWVLRWGSGCPGTKRLAFWHWALGLGPSTKGSSVLQTAARADPKGLLWLAAGLGEAPPSVEVAGLCQDRLAAALGAELPDHLVLSLLQLGGSRIWLLSHTGLLWLTKQCRCFQVTIAAQHPQLFRHLMGEGLAPELFYSFWLQGLFTALLPSADVLRVLDIFVVERSHKIFVRVAVAIFGLLEKQLLGKDIERMMDILFKTEAWNFAPGQLLAAALAVKVTRTSLREIS